MTLMETYGLFQEYAQLRNIYWEDDYDPEEVVTREQFRSGHEAHVWYASTKEAFSTNSNFTLLSEEEKTKSLNYKFVRDRNRYVNSHGILRRILAAYLRLAPCELTYEYTKYGKPLLANDTAEKNIHFNMTHAEDAVCYIVSGNEAGIDAEKMKRDFDWRSIAGKYFSCQEKLILKCIPRDRQATAFFYIWTRKEALLKALGVGLSGVQDDVLSQSADTYTLVSFKFERNFQCSLAVHSTTSTVKFFRWAQ